MDKETGSHPFSSYQVLTVAEDGKITFAELQEEQASSSQQWQITADVFSNIRNG